MKTINIKIPATGAKSYKIQIGKNKIAEFWSEIESEFRQNKFIVTDENLVLAGHLKKLLKTKDVPFFAISPAGETSKNINTAVSIIEAMEKAFLGRDTVIIALGGGTVGDIAGFAAAVFKRGVSVIQMPTTTVAQADSAVGGKTGVDSSVSKNAFGAFWQPAAVYIDVATLLTLDERQFKAGLVESVKHALIADEAYFALIEENIDEILQRNLDLLEKMAYLNCRIKAKVVEVDPDEQNQRRMLNYGHTIGHAVESVSSFELLHGEAIAIGIIGAGLIEAEMGLAKNGRLDRIRTVLQKLSVPTKLPNNMDTVALIETIRRDKKAVNKWPKFVLIDKIGNIYCRNRQWAVDVEPAVVEKVLNKLK